MRILTAVVPFIVVFALVGCAPEAPVATPDPTVSPSAEQPSSSPSAPEHEATVSLPGECETLVPLSIVHSDFSDNFESIAMDAASGDPVAQSFRDRNGLTCLWGIPNSDAGVTLFVGERATSTDAEQVSQWSAAGYAECSAFLDACFHESGVDEVGAWQLLHALVDGYEIRVHGSSATLDPLLSLARTAATNMGHN